MAKHKMAATEMATDRITSKECHGFFFHISGLPRKTPDFGVISRLLRRRGVGVFWKKTLCRGQPVG